MALDLGLVHRHALDGRDVDGVRDVQFGVQLAGGIQGETERMVGCFAEVGAEDDVREQVPAGGAGAVDDEHRAGGLLRHGAHRVAHDGAHTGGVGIAGGAARAHDDEIGLDLAGVAQNFGGRHTHAQFHAEGAGTGFNLIGVGRIELFAHHLLIRLIRLLKAAAAGIGDVGGEPTGGDAAAMVERQFRLLLFRQPKSQFRGVVAAGRSRTRKQDVLEQHLATP